MKNIVTSILILLGCATYQNDVVAQDIDTKQLRFGAFVAPTASWMKPTANKSDDNEYLTSGNGTKLGFTYGLMAEYRFADNYSFVTGLQINMAKGGITTKRDMAPADSAAFVTNTVFDYSIQYLEVPIALKMRTNLIGGLRFFGQLGITPSFNIAKKTSYVVNYFENGNNKVASDENVKLKGALAITPILFQMNIGIGAEYPINDQLCGYLGVFFNNGFAPDVTNPNKYTLLYPGSFKDGNIRLNNFAFRVGLFF